MTFFKLAVSRSSLLTPTFYLSLRFWTGRGLYANYCTSNMCIRDIQITFSDLSGITIISQMYWQGTVNRILGKIDVLDVFMHQKQEWKTKEAEMTELLVVL